MSAPGTMVKLSAPYNPAILKGIKIHLQDPFVFDFILDPGSTGAGGSTVEPRKLIKYFLAAITTPEKDQWVNLSPYEKDRTVPESFGQTEMGRDLLAQDYMLKQVTASLIYPEDHTGKTFWEKVYAEAAKRYGTINIPINTFNKVWIVPGKAVVYENALAGTAYEVESRLKVMLEEDYRALDKNRVPTGDAQALGNEIVRQIIIPALTTEVNEGANFAQLRQVYNSLVLAAWYKKKIKDGILAQVYADQNKVEGIKYTGRTNPKIIYENYLAAFKKGVYNYIKEEQDPLTNRAIPRKYFSGGFSSNQFTADGTLSVVDEKTASEAMLGSLRAIVSKLLVVTSGLRFARARSFDSKDPAQVLMGRRQAMRRIGGLFATSIGAAVASGCGPMALNLEADRILQLQRLKSQIEPLKSNLSDIRMVDSVQRLIDIDDRSPYALYRVGLFKEGRPVVLVVHGVDNTPKRLETFLKAYEKLGYNIFAIKYDYKKSLDESAKNFNKHIVELDASHPFDDFTVVSFSFGGNVVFKGFLQASDERKVKIYGKMKFAALSPIINGALIPWLYWPGAKSPIEKIGELIEYAGVIQTFLPDSKEVRNFREQFPNFMNSLKLVKLIVGAKDYFINDPENVSRMANTKREILDEFRSGGRVFWPFTTVISGNVGHSTMVDSPQAMELTRQIIDGAPEVMREFNERKLNLSQAMMTRRAFTRATVAAVAGVLVLGSGSGTRSWKPETVRIGDAQLGNIRMRDITADKYPNGFYLVDDYHEGQPSAVVVHGLWNTPKDLQEHLKGYADKGYNMFVYKYDVTRPTSELSAQLRGNV